MGKGRCRAKAQGHRGERSLSLRGEGKGFAGAAFEDAPEELLV